MRTGERIHFAAVLPARRHDRREVSLMRTAARNHSAAQQLLQPSCHYVLARVPVAELNRSV